MSAAFGGYPSFSGRPPCVFSHSPSPYRGGKKLRGIEGGPCPHPFKGGRGDSLESVALVPHRGASFRYFVF